MNTKTLRETLYWGVPIWFCLLLYAPGLRAWFQDDDFVWLNLLPGVHTWSDLWDALFRPTIHGTWRPLGERAYFLSLQSLFGPYALPFRIVAFLTQFANLALISAITQRLTGSRIAGFLAPILWIVNTRLVPLMGWNSVYIDVLCAFFLLTAFLFLLLYIATAERRYYFGMWAAFLLGFGAMETIIVFPILAAVYTLLFARTFFRKTLPLFVPSLMFGTAHLLWAPKETVGPYVMHFDTAIFKTFATYWTWVFEPNHLSEFTKLPPSAGPAGMIVFTLALLGFSASQIYKRNLLPAFFLSWFAILLLPILPLRDHLTDYYVTLPMIGIAMLGAHAFAKAWNDRLIWRGAASVLLALFLLESVPAARGSIKWYFERSRRMKHLVLGVQAAHLKNPGKTILLDGIDDDLFWGAIDEQPFRFMGITGVFLTPGSESRITARPELDRVTKFTFPVEQTRAQLASGQLLVYRSDNGRLTDITKDYAMPEGLANAERDQFLDVAEPSNADRLGPTWYPAGQGFRWSPKRATVRMKAPLSEGRKLYVSGYCTAAQLAKGPVRLTVSVDGVAFPAVTVEKGDAPFHFDFPLKAGSPGPIEVAVEVDRTFSTPADNRELGLVFGSFEIR